MRLIHRHRDDRRGKAPRISFSQAELAADLHYPAARRPAPQPASVRRGGR